MIEAVLIDDEPAANRSLTAMLDRAHPEINITGMAMTVRDGINLIERLAPQLIFLDINLPDGRGFDLVRQLPGIVRPEIIFVTSEENYAMQAIKVAALGYLLKPVDTRELAQSVAIASMRIRQRNSEHRLNALMSNLAERDVATKQISIPSEKGVAFVRAGDIIYCTGVDGYTSIHLTDGARHLSSYSIGEYRKMLEPFGFYAVHRSHLVNRAHVRGWVDGGHLRMANAKSIAVSRRRKEAVSDWLTGK